MSANESSALESQISDQDTSSRAASRAADTSGSSSGATSAAEMDLVPVVMKTPGFECMTIPVMTGRVSIALLLETMSKQIHPFFEADYGLPFMRDQIKTDRALRVAGQLAK